MKVHFYNKPTVDLNVVRVVPNTDQTVGVYYLINDIEQYTAAQYVEL